jgi:tetratricopeptide (TPR) repeat protein
MNRNPLRLAVLFFLLAAGAQARAALTMHVSAAQHTEAAKASGPPGEPGKPAPILPPDSQQQLDVTLADSYISVASANSRTIYDFKARRRIVINLAEKTYVDYSLFDAPGFRMMELQNRLHLNAALHNAKLDAALGRPVDIENELSIAANTASVIDETAAGDMREFSSAGGKLAAWSNSGAKVGAADAAEFAQFLRYAQGGHPQVLDKIAKGDAIPERMTLTIRGAFGVRTVNLAMTAVKSAPVAAYSLAGYKRRAAAGGIEALMDRIAAMSPEQLAALRAAHPCDTSSDFSPAQIVDTMLGRLECMLATGAPMAKLTAEQQQAANAPSSPIASMFAAIGASKRDDYAGAIKTLEALRSQAPRKAYILKLFEANNRLRLGQYKESMRLFGEVLDANPVLGGAYKDLGDLLLMQYDSQLAWRCWDAGRRVSPGLPNFEAVNKFEAAILAQHPEYF